MITRKEPMSNAHSYTTARRYLTINSVPLLFNCPNNLYAPKNGNVNPTYDFDITKRVRYMKFK